MRKTKKRSFSLLSKHIFILECSDIYVMKNKPKTPTKNALKIRLKFTCSCSVCFDLLLLQCDSNLRDIYTHSLSLLPPISVPLCYSFTLFSLRAFRMTYEIRPLLPDIHMHTHTQRHCDGLPEVITHLHVVRPSHILPAHPRQWWSGHPDPRGGG